MVGANGICQEHTLAPLSIILPSTLWHPAVDIAGSKLQVGKLKLHQASGSSHGRNED